LGKKVARWEEMGDRTSSQNPYILELELKIRVKKSMPKGIEVEGYDEVVSAQEIAESQAALADYFAGRDREYLQKNLN
jgi:hypothetical protein